MPKSFKKNENKCKYIFSGLFFDKKHRFFRVLGVKNVFREEIGSGGHFMPHDSP